MPYSSGNATLPFPFGGLTTNGTGIPRTPVFESPIVRLLKLLGGRHRAGESSGTNRITLYNRDVIFGDSPTEAVWRRVVHMAKSEGISLIVALAAEKFREIPETMDVYARTEGGITVLSVVVNMPQYNDQVMQSLVEKELEVDGLAEGYGESLDYRYLPYQLIDPDLSLPDHLGRLVQSW